MRRFNLNFFASATMPLLAVTVASCTTASALPLPPDVARVVPVSTSLPADEGFTLADLCVPADRATDDDRDAGRVCPTAPEAVRGADSLSSPTGMPDFAALMVLINQMPMVSPLSVGEWNPNLVMASVGALAAAVTAGVGLGWIISTLVTASQPPAQGTGDDSADRTTTVINPTTAESASPVVISVHPTTVYETAAPVTTTVVTSEPSAPVTVTQTATTTEKATQTLTVTQSPATVTHTAKPVTTTETAVPTPATVTATSLATVTEITTVTTTATSTPIPETVVVTTTQQAAPETITSSVTETVTPDPVTVTSTAQVAPETTIATVTETTTQQSAPVTVTTTVDADPDITTASVTTTETASPVTTTSTTTSTTTVTETTTSTTTVTGESSDQSSAAQPEPEPEPKTPKQLALEAWQAEIDRSDRLIPLIGAYGPALQPFANRHKSYIANANRYDEQAIKSNTAQLKAFNDSYAAAAGVDESSGKSAEETKREELKAYRLKLENIQNEARSQGIRDNAAVAIAAIDKELAKNPQTIQGLEAAKYRAQASVDKLRKDTDKEKQARDEFELKRSEAKAKLAARPVTPYSEDGKTVSIEPNKVYELAMLIQDTLPAARTLPDQKNGFTDADADPEYDQFDSVDEILGAPDSAKYKAATALTDKIREKIRAEFDAGRGDFYDSNPDNWIQYVLPADDIATLKPLMDLNDRYNARMLENINQLRRKLGLREYQAPPMSDYQKAQMIVHAIAEYEAGIRIKNKVKGATSGHTRTKAVKLAPHEPDTGWNENYFGSYNHPFTARHFTPEMAADEFFSLVLDEANAYKDDPDDADSSGHFTNDIDFGLEYMHGSMFVGDIVEQSNGTKKFTVSITDLFYKVTPTRPLGA